VLVFTQWAWSYFTYERGARLITGSTDLPGWNALESERSADAAAEPEMSTTVDK
jgi:NADH dehydrogenase